MPKAKKRETRVRKKIARKAGGKRTSKKTGGKTMDNKRTGNKRDEPALKQNYTRAKVVDGLASNINRIFKDASYRNKHEKFYFKLLKCFLRQPSNNRFVLLNSVNGMDLHPRYTLGNLPGAQQMVVTADKQNLNVTLTVKYQPQKDHRFNCYCYELLLLTWNKKSEEPTYFRDYSDWIDPKEPEPEFDFSFKRQRGVVHWLLCLMKQMGRSKKFVSVKLQGMRIMEVGTFNKQDEELLKKIAGEEKKKISSSQKKEDEIVRVKAKKRS